MVERCTFCGSTHETGDPNETVLGGMRMRICPEVPNPPGFIMFNSRDWIPPGTPLTDLFPSGLDWPVFRNLVPRADMLDKYPEKTAAGTMAQMEAYERMYGDRAFKLFGELDLNIATVATAPRPTLSRPGILDTAKPPIL